MSQPDSLARFAATAGLPRDPDGPVFAAAWQAEAFALTVRLHDEGCFTWPEWAATLGAVFQEVRERGETDDGSRYYEHWLLALERIVTAKRLLATSDLMERKAAWVAAYLATPHGQPVELRTHDGSAAPGGAG